MSRRDYLKHLGFATAQAMANTKKTQTMALPRELFDKIEKASINFGIENQTASPYIAYRRGATEWAGRDQGLVDAVMAVYKDGPGKQSTVDLVNKALVSFYGSDAELQTALAKYKEVSNAKN